MNGEWNLNDIANPTQEHSMLREMVRDFTIKEVEPQALEYDKKEIFNVDLFKKLGDYGLLGISVPEEYGGAGMDSTAVAIVNEELSYSDPGFCLAYLAHAQLMVNNLAQNGSDEQKSRILPKVCSGDWIGCMAMSEPGYGTDVLGMQTSAVQQDNGTWIINGNKMWITNGAIDDSGTPADIVWLYARTGTDSKGRAEITTFLVERGMEGYSVGQKIYDKAGMRASNTAELVFDNCIVPNENVVGNPGESMIHMMRNLEIERIALAAMSLGIARRSLSAMNKYASEREAFGNQIRDFGQIQRHIGESYAEYRAMRAYIYDTAANTNLSMSGNRLDSDGVKLFATTAAKNIADRAIQVMGGYGYVGEYVVERLWRDSKLLEIGGGTLEGHHKNITRDLAKNTSNIDG
ncbi:MAG: isovaleryl-CoA dehydrogenase [Euryarchaeota archaeon]|jgi:isovaleryl-CoA dehydrogenase|nr:isovaleryl-CoA dehydrogenase [Euryarchaeota archaeon]MBT4391083.1 isovaleryl-CoA dehydrogenase [Euryarchaeota archaeon]MBT4803297.1 isovaleryl-CoA dehydrogenase [Euryarchaeota archaeon]MBT5613870.1 isovaleryl-CoA dehydrogenase [Euryarchaeota archaeon]MBT6683928.1 isovaleryl-CoA dehydrogenase [Euryarchaeota archaeon]